MAKLFDIANLNDVFEVNTKSSLTQLSTLAAKRALVDANVDPSEISILIQCTSSSEDAFGDATTVAHNLGLSKDVVRTLMK